jgi:hypothetical protein
MGSVRTRPEPALKGHEGTRKAVLRIKKLKGVVKKNLE